jgi:hypothetical protein
MSVKTDGVCVDRRGDALITGNRQCTRKDLVASAPGDELIGQDILQPVAANQRMLQFFWRLRLSRLQDISMLLRIRIQPEISDTEINMQQIPGHDDLVIVTRSDGLFHIDFGLFRPLYRNRGMKPGRHL